jgi:uncharacterized membrane protein YheB (UPF0754 family)
MKPKKFATQIDEKVLIQLKKYASISDKSISKIVTEAVADYLNKVQLRKVFTDAMDSVIEENAELLERLAK